MSSIDLVDPEQRDLAASFPLFDPTPAVVAQFRSDLNAGLSALVSPDPTDAQAQAIPVDEGLRSIRTLIHRPIAQEQNAPAILYFHGGGLIAGTPDMMAGASDKIANETGAVVIAPDYRLAPEAPFPAGLEDAYAALRWAYANADRLGIDPTRISVMGDSAGGCLAAGVALLARDRGEIRLRSQILIYPMLDLRTGSDDEPDSDPLTGEFVWARPQNQFAWGLVKGDALIDNDQLGYLSPTFMQDLTGLPPTFIMTGALDLYRDEDINYAQRLMRAGVPTDLIVYAGAVHVFDILPGELGERARKHLIAAIQRLA
jgi:acetyl esterase/lipase